jgi:hypothetical protein
MATSTKLTNIVYDVKPCALLFKIILIWKTCSIMDSLLWRSCSKWYTVNSIWKHVVFAYPKRERYCFNRFCFEIALQITLSIELSWLPELARYFKKESTDIVAFSFGISENTVFSNAISVSFGRWTVESVETWILKYKQSWYVQCSFPSNQYKNINVYQLISTQFGPSYYYYKKIPNFMVF